MAAQYELHYWPTIPGRGEFVRLALEEAAAPYDDVARRPESEGGGRPAVTAILAGDKRPPFAAIIENLRRPNRGAEPSTQANQGGRPHDQLSRIPHPQ